MVDEGEIIGADGTKTHGFNLVIFILLHLVRSVGWPVTFMQTTVAVIKQSITRPSQNNNFILL